MRRREFLCALATAPVVWPLAAKAQNHVRLIGVLMAASPDDPESQARIAALQQGLQEAGWVNGRNIKLDTRWSGSDIARLRRDAADLIAKGADVIVGGVGPTLPVLQQTSRIVPVVMAQVIDPVGAGFVQSLAQPGGNMTGFTQFEYSLSGKWLELLKEIAPQVSRVGVVRDLQGGPVGIAQWAVIGAFASPMGVELSPINLSETADTKPALAAFARGPNDGLIVTVG
jgi:putative ABC transport system substrate-binding protein